MDVESEGLPPAEPAVQEMDLAARRRLFISQPSTLATRKQQAVCVRRAYKQYGSKKNPNIVLDGLNMTVPKGAIYGLLGASGCGKTTLLACIVGRRRLNSGELWVLGGHPGTRGSGVPGPRIGYMPQEVALYGEFTVRETLSYFGMIAGMDPKRIKERTDFLLHFLQMPGSSRFVKNLSGGQQRRMSLAAALVHEPELLILDEPTVGVDPVLRQSIWDHLVDIATRGNQTVIITTHYIDETRQANVIGLLRGGRMLAEESPEYLLRKYRCQSLEEVFLKLAIFQNMGKRRRSSIAQEVSEQVNVPAISNPALDMSDEDRAEISGEFGDNVSMSSRALETIETDVINAPLPPDEETPMTFWERMSIMKSHHVKALMWKNMLWMWRNFGVMAFIVGLPVMQIILFCYAIGHDPKGLPLAIANYELNDVQVAGQECPWVKGCNYTYMSCRYLTMLKQKTIGYKFYESDEDAFEEVRKGNAWGAMVFSSNYSESLVERTEEGRYAENSSIIASEVTVRLDMSNQQISTMLYRDIQLTYFDFIESILVDCGVSPKVGRIPINWNKPIYGDRIPNFTDFAAPGVILTVIFFLSVAMTTGAMLIERNEGMLERCLVSGITGSEILFAQVTTQFALMFCQTLLVIMFSFYIFDVTNHGNMGLIILLCTINGLCGMCFGFVIACAVDTERTATYVAMGSFLPIVMLCGIIWPIEGMYPILRIASLFLPLTYSTESLRSILQRGWGLEHSNVQNGYASILLWTMIFMLASIFLLKFKKG